MYSKLVCGLALTVGAAHGAAHNLVRRDGAHGHHGGGGGAAPASAYAAPASPSAGYNAPATGYEAAAPSSYDAPATGYGEPYSDSGYGVSGYGEEGGFDIATLLIPILILAGLSLLFPTITTVSVRRKRHAEGEGKNTNTTKHVDTRGGIICEANGTTIS